MTLLSKLTKAATPLVTIFGLTLVTHVGHAQTLMEDEHITASTADLMSRNCAKEKAAAIESSNIISCTTSAAHAVHVIANYMKRDIQAIQGKLAPFNVDMAQAALQVDCIVPIDELIRRKGTGRYKSDPGLYATHSYLWAQRCGEAISRSGLAVDIKYNSKAVAEVHTALGQLMKHVHGDEPEPQVR